MRDFSPNNLFVGGESAPISLENTGSVPHTFTIEELDIDVELEPGANEDLDLPTDKGGNYIFVCRFHEDQVMKGTLSIATPR